MRGDWGWVHVNLIPLNPTPGLEVDRLRPGRRARVRPPARGQGHPHHRARHPRQRDRRRLRPAGRHRGLGPCRSTRRRRGRQAALGVAARRRRHRRRPTSGWSCATPTGPTRRWCWPGSSRPATRPGARRGAAPPPARTRARLARGRGRARCAAAACDLLAARSTALEEAGRRPRARPDRRSARPRRAGAPVSRRTGRRRPEAALAYNAASVDIFGVAPMSQERAATVASENAQRLAGRRGAGVGRHARRAPGRHRDWRRRSRRAALTAAASCPTRLARGLARVLRHRLDHGAEHGAWMAITRGRVATSGPILRRAGFEAFGSERAYRVPLR